MQRAQYARWTVAALVVLASIAIALSIAATRVTPILRERAVKVLEQRYQSKVTLRSFTVSLFPRVSITGEGLEMRIHGRTDVPPAITVGRFHATAFFWQLVHRPMHVSYVRLESMKLTLPPKGSGSGLMDASAPKNAEKTNGSDLLVIDEIDADGAFLSILPKIEGKEPLEFQITKLNLRSVGKDQPMAFRATLTNPKPPGLIESSGHFGPWQNEEPGDSAVDGHYTFSQADLSVFHGIAGILSSVGDYRGQLNHIDVTGTTDVPDFAIAHAGDPVHLSTDFHATVDGTNGDTYLTPVNARFLQTALVCRGAVIHKPGGPHGKTVELDVKMAHGRVEDILKLAVKSHTAGSQKSIPQKTTQMMTGAMQLHTKFFLPPGPREVIERLRLDGDFSIHSVQFAANGIQDKIAELSRRGEGHPNEPLTRVSSDFQGVFTLQEAIAHFSSLRFDVPGAQVALTSDYGLKTERVAFTGQLRTEAKVSQMVNGWKSALLKVVDPFFSRNGAGTQLNIHIAGTRQAPEFGVDLFHHSPKQR